MNIKYIRNISWNIVHKAGIMLMLSWSIAGASFESTFTGSRPAGMANSYSAIGDDIHAMFFNPAGLARIKRSESLLQYNPIYQGLDDDSSLNNTMLGIAVPISRSNCIGVGYTGFSLSSLYSERTLSGSYSRTLNPSMSVGATGKILMKAIGGRSSDDPIYGKSKSGLDIDCGFLYNWKKGYFLSAVIKNLMQTDMAIVSGYSDKVPRDITVGANYKDRLFGINFEVTMHQQYTSSVILSVGAEQWFNTSDGRKLGFRGGLMVNSQNQYDVAFGFGYYTENVGIDYAIRTPLAGVDSMGTHHIGVVLKFRKEKKIAFVEKLEERIEIPIKEATKTAKLEYESAIDYYRKQVAAGMPLSDQYNLLKTIILKYKRRGVEVANEEKEIEVLEEKLKKEVSQDMREKSLELYRNAVVDTNAGLYADALDKIREANVLNAEDKTISELRNKLEAISAVTAKVRGQSKAAIYLRNGMKAYIDNDIPKSLNWLRYTTEKDPENIDAARMLELVETEYPDMATRDRYDPAVGIISLKLQRSLEYIYDGKYPLAIAESKDVIDLERNNVTAWKRMGSAFYALNRVEKAKECWAEAIRLNPKDKELIDFLKSKGIDIKAAARRKTRAPVRTPEVKKTYVIKKSDTLPIIAEKFYGNKSRWREIYNANKKIIGNNPYKLAIGMKLVIP